MNDSTTSGIRWVNRYFTRQLAYRSAIVLLVLNGVVACASAQTQTDPPVIVEKLVVDDGLASADFVYNARDYEAALKEFEAIAKNPMASSNSRRLAYLGQALIYLSSDQRWHSLENAKMALRSAGTIASKQDEEFLLSTDMMMDSILISIGANSRYAELLGQSGNSKSEVVRLKSERDALLAENEKLRKEQTALSDALEKLKNLSLGN